MLYLKTWEFKFYIEHSQFKVNDVSAKAIQSYSNDMLETGATGVIGHYTQEVWSKTEEVGCGLIKFRDDSGWIKTVSFINIHMFSLIDFSNYLWS